MSIRELLSRYHQGLCTSDELELVQSYLSGDKLPDLKRMLDEDWRDEAKETNVDDQETEQRIWFRLSRLVSEDSQTHRLSRTIQKRFRQKFLWQWAAASVILLAGSWFLGQRFASKELTYEMNRSKAVVALVEKINQTTKPMLVTLKDGSQVELSPTSKISYTNSFGSGIKREVYLSGEAFFKVTPNPDKPFFVYANELVTKVLGTSFTVKAYENDKSVTVKVSTGRVSVAVAEELSSNQNISIREKEGILLTPNQQAVLSRREFHLLKSLVENPLLIIPEGKIKIEKEAYSFKFESARATAVFEAIEKGYGVNIAFDEKIFEHCQLTADLSGESLYEKLDIVCKSMDAEYKVLDAQIIITGKGCNF